MFVKSISMKIRLNDLQWINACTTSINLRATQGLLGKTERYLRQIESLTKPLFDSFQDEFKKALEFAENPVQGSKRWIEINNEVAKTFEVTDTELDIPELTEPDMDDLLFAPGQKGLLMPIFTENKAKFHIVRETPVKKLKQG